MSFDLVGSYSRTQGHCKLWVHLPDGDKRHCPQPDGHSAAVVAVAATVVTGISLGDVHMMPAWHVACLVAAPGPSGLGCCSLVAATQPFLLDRVSLPALSRVLRSHLIPDAGLRWVLLSAFQEKGVWARRPGSAGFPAGPSWQLLCRRSLVCPGQDPGPGVPTERPLRSRDRIIHSEGCPEPKGEFGWFSAKQDGIWGALFSTDPGAQRPPFTCVAALFLGHGHSASRLSKKPPHFVKGKVFSHTQGGRSKECSHWRTERDLLLLDATRGAVPGAGGASVGTQSLKTEAALTSGKWESHKTLCSCWRLQRCRNKLAGVWAKCLH